MSKKPKDKAHKQTAKDPESKINELQVQVDHLTEALSRERADAINLRRHHDEQIKNLRSNLKAEIVKELLPIIDNFERALAHTPKELEGSDYVKGVQGIVKQFEKTLDDMGVKKIKTVGEPFDPNLHEAVSAEGSGKGKEIISEEVQTGYLLEDNVIRHALVKVKNK